jgi:hypothetical protein
VCCRLVEDGDDCGTPNDSFSESEREWEGQSEGVSECEHEGGVQAGSKKRRRVLISASDADGNEEEQLGSTDDDIAVVDDSDDDQERRRGSDGDDDDDSVVSLSDDDDSDEDDVCVLRVIDKGEPLSSPPTTTKYCFPVARKECESGLRK